MNGFIGKKKEMTQIFTEEGNMCACTIIDISNLKVVGIKTVEKNGYTAVVLGKDSKKENTVSKSLKGHYSSAKFFPVKAKEFKIDDAANLEVGSDVNVENLKEGVKVDVTGISKGKGFQGVVRRWGMHGGPKTHGQSDKHRSVGSIAAGQTLAHVLPGRHMAGKMGNEKKTVKNLKVMKVDNENKVILVKGAIPGSLNSYVFINIVK